MERSHSTKFNGRFPHTILDVGNEPSGPKSRETTLPIVGLVNEQERVCKALTKRESVLLLGPRGCGKTTVIRAAISTLPIKTNIVYVRYAAGLHELLTSIARALLGCGHGYFHRLVPKNTDPEKWLKQQTSLHLRGLLWNALETDPRLIILDEVDGASYPIYRFLQRLYFADGMVMCAAAHNSVALGALHRLFWDPEKIIHFKPLSSSDASLLFDRSIEHFRLGELDIEEFRPKVLEAANGNAGQIVEMCRLANDPQYISGRYIKFAPLRIDAMVKFLG